MVKDIYNYNAYSENLQLYLISKSPVFYPYDIPFYHPWDIYSFPFLWYNNKATATKQECLENPIPGT